MVIVMNCYHRKRKCIKQLLIWVLGILGMSQDSHYFFRTYLKTSFWGNSLMKWLEIILFSFINNCNVCTNLQTSVWNFFVDFIVTFLVVFFEPLENWTKTNLKATTIKYHSHCVLTEDASSLIISTNATACSRVHR